MNSPCDHVYLEMRLAIELKVRCSICIVLYCIVLYCIVLYCVVLYCIVLCCVALYCIRLSASFTLSVSYCELDR